MENFILAQDQTNIWDLTTLITAFIFPLDKAKIFFIIIQNVKMLVVIKFYSKVKNRHFH